MKEIILRYVFPFLLVYIVVFFWWKPFQPKVELTGNQVPEWAQNVIWYQIFPERFRDGDPSNNPTAERINAPEGWHITSWIGDWYAQDNWEKDHGSFYRSATTRRYGGDLQGVIDKLDYLQDLGITGIYFNPIFDAVSLHKYDASYYHHIDRHFGPDPEGDLKIMQEEDPSDPSTWQWTSADLLFLELLEEAKNRNIRIIIDGVWNHTGRDFWAFRDIIKNGEASRFKDWYKITEFSDEHPDGFDYEGWWGYRGLPEFTEVGEDIHPEVKDHIFAVTERWMAPNGDVSKGIDGWRLDVTEELGHTFWKDWHTHVRFINKEAYTVAEIWDDKARDFVTDEMFNAVMNYRWTYATHDFFINQNIQPEEFSRRLNLLLDDFPMSMNLSMQNLMDSHDTERLASMVVNRDKDYKQDSKIREAVEGNYNVRKPINSERELQKLVSLFQFTYLGSPMIYYGTEVGMWGADDPDDRKPMMWYDMDFEPERSHPLGHERPVDSLYFDRDLLNYYQRISVMRNSIPALQSGEFLHIPLDGNPNIFCFIRHTDNSIAIIALNRNSNSIEIKIDLTDLNLPFSEVYTDFLSGVEYSIADGILFISVDGRDGKVLY